MNWWQTLYTESVADILLDTDAAHVQAEQTAKFICDQAGLVSGDVVFDQCCGTGRVSLPLAQHGMQVIGVEQCATYVSRARELCKGTTAQFHTGDACQFVTDQACKAVINWWTSFGYAETDTDNLRMLDCAFNSLQAGGTLLLDFHNAASILRLFQAEVVNEMDDRSLTRRSQIDLQNGRLDKQWIWHYADGRQEQHDSSVRLYHPHELVTLMQTAGFTAIELFGDSDGQPCTLDSPRCIVTGRRP